MTTSPDPAHNITGEKVGFSEIQPDELASQIERPETTSGTARFEPVEIRRQSVRFRVY